MIRRVERRADDDPGALRDGADARDALHRGIILAVIESRVARPRPVRSAAKRRFSGRRST
jgi:hypothetical protein